MLTLDMIRTQNSCLSRQVTSEPVGQLWFTSSGYMIIETNMQSVQTNVSCDATQKSAAFIIYSLCFAYRQVKLRIREIHDFM